MSLNRSIQLLMILGGSLLISSLQAHASIGEYRRFQLDSITTNIEKDIRRDLGKVHEYLHGEGQTDEERVWMFYGFIATHFKYDYDRKNEADAKDYSAGYTTKKLSGVCRDFADVFKELCDKSKIPCLVVHGKTPSGIFGCIDVIRRFFQGISNKTNHAWNVVKIDGQWKIADPTWSGIVRVEKKYRYDEKLKRQVPVQIRIVNRTWYAPDPEVAKKDHKPVHPAFFTSSEVPTFKTALRKEKRRKSYLTGYDYSRMLDSIYAERYPMFSKAYQEDCKKYSSQGNLFFLFREEMTLPEQKTAEPVTIEQYEASIVRIKELAFYLKENYGYESEHEVKAYEQVVQKKITQIKRAQENAQKQKTKGKSVAVK